MLHRLTILVFFSFTGGLAGTFWWTASRAAKTRTGRSALGYLAHFLIVLLLILPLIFAERSIDLKVALITFLAGAILGCGLRELMEGTSKLDLLIGNCALIFLLALYLVN